MVFGIFEVFEWVFFGCGFSCFGMNVFVFFFMKMYFCWRWCNICVVCKLVFFWYGEEVINDVIVKSEVISNSKD